MKKFIFAYHGGSVPQTPEEGEATKNKWMNWLGSLGKAVVSPGNPVGLSKTVTASGVEDNGGANPLSGFSIVQAASIEEACKLANGCPAHEDGGSVEVAEIVEM